MTWQKGSRAIRTSEFYTDKHTPSVGDKVQFLIVYNEDKKRNEAHDVHDEKSYEFDNDNA